MPCRTTPSVVGFTKNGERVVGEAARRQQAVNSGRTVLSIKRELGIPVKFIGVGEKIDDMQEFNAAEFIKALFEQ